MMDRSNGLVHQNVKKNLRDLKRDPRLFKWTDKYIKGGIRRTESEMGVEQTLILIKPDAFKRKLVGKVIQRFEEKGFFIKQLKTYDFTDEKAQDFIQFIKVNPFLRN